MCYPAGMRELGIDVACYCGNRRVLVRGVKANCTTCGRPRNARLLGLVPTISAEQLIEEKRARFAAKKAKRADAFHERAIRAACTRRKNALERERLARASERAKESKTILRKKAEIVTPL